MRHRGREPFGRDSLSPPEPACLRLPPHGASVPLPSRNVPPGMRLPVGFRPGRGRAAGFRGTGGTPPVEAAAVIVDLVRDMLHWKASGIRLNRRQAGEAGA